MAAKEKDKAPNSNEETAKQTAEEKEQAPEENSADKKEDAEQEMEEPALEEEIPEP